MILLLLILVFEHRALALSSAAPAAVPAILAWQRAVAGAGAYCAATLVSSPLDVVKGARAALELRPLLDSTAGAHSRMHAILRLLSSATALRL